MEPCRARPVCFCGLGFAPPPETCERVLVAAVPCLAFDCWLIAI